MATDPVFETLREFVKESRAVVDGAEQALAHYQQGDTQGACDTASLTHYKISAAEDVWQALMKFFDQNGVRPGQGR